MIKIIFCLIFSYIIVISIPKKTKKSNFFGRGASYIKEPHDVFPIQSFGNSTGEHAMLVVSFKS